MTTYESIDALMSDIDEGIFTDVIEDIGSGMFVIGGFKRITDPNEIVRIALEDNEDVYVAHQFGSCGSGCGVPIFFIGEILWSSSEITENDRMSDALDWGDVPAGRLISSMYHR